MPTDLDWPAAESLWRKGYSANQILRMVPNMLSRNSIVAHMARRNIKHEIRIPDHAHNDSQTRPLTLARTKFEQGGSP